MGLGGFLLSLGMFLTIAVWGGIVVLVALFLFWPLGLFLAFFWALALLVTGLTTIVAPFAGRT